VDEILAIDLDWPKISKRGKLNQQSIKEFGRGYKELFGGGNQNERR